MIQRLHELFPRQFADALQTVVSHSRPIDDEQHLKGRTEQLESVTQAIYAPGRHVFVFGERGVGKTSLAKTAARRAATTPECFKQIGCSSDSNFDDIIRLILEVFDRKRLAAFQKTSSWGFQQWLGVGQSSNESYAPPKITVSLAADALASLDNERSDYLRVVVIDEMDRILEQKIREQFAELVKLLGDRGSKITIIFTGVGSDLEQILGGHASSFRQLAQIPLERINYQSSLDIVDDALAKFGLAWETEPTRTARFRIASIANGFPYYVHLLMEKLLYKLYEDKAASHITHERLSAAISSAVMDAQEEIRKPYDKATRGRALHYKLTTWAVADSWELERTADRIYDSYLGICKKLDEEPQSRRQFLQIMASLKRQTHGPILRAGYRKGQYLFTENIVRGYVRLCAASEGIELNDIRPDENGPKITAQVKEKRYIDPRRLGGAPSTLER